MLSNIKSLVDAFSAGLNTFLSSSKYTEAEVRSEFIDEFFITLGWDVHNTERKSPSFREVVIERAQQSLTGGSKRPDYTFRINQKSLFHVEAKKPSVDVKTHVDSIFQARRYGYTDEHAISVITNFRSLSIYDASVPVNESYDTAETALLARWDYTEYLHEINNIVSYLSREKVGLKEWEELVNLHAPKQFLPAGEEFLQSLNQWRLELAESLIKNNPSIDEYKLNDDVQLILNRLLFIRMCEDRGIELEETLRKSVSGDRINVGTLFESMDRRYDTGLFAGSSLQDDPSKVIDGSVFRNIVDRLYAPASPFSFAVLNSDFLGRVYEQSLTEKIVVDTSNSLIATVKLAKKDEYLYRDVVTTPQELVDVVVSEAMDYLDYQNDLPKILDFAAGSGRFLIQAYRQLIEKEIARRLENGELSSLVKIAEGEYRLPFADKVKIMRESVYGIDIDFNAVEVAKFSSIITLLEDEDVTTLPSSSEILPDLSANIVQGNTIIRPVLGRYDLLEAPTYALDLESIGFSKFDLIIGNPPYVATEQMRKINKVEFDEIKRTYKTAQKQWDKYFAFVEFASNRLSNRGVLGVVIPNKWMTVVSAGKLRSLLRADVSVRWLQNFTYHSVFEEKQIYVCGLIATKEESDTFLYGEPKSLLGFSSANAASIELNGEKWLPADKEDPWVLPASIAEQDILLKILADAIPLGDILEARNGLQTSANDVFLLKNVEFKGGYASFSNKIKGKTETKKWVIETDLLIPYLDDSRQIQSFRSVIGDSWLLFPYKEDKSKRSGASYIDESVMINKYPKTYEYLTYCRERLLKRDFDRSQPFYVYGRTQALGYVRQTPKIFYSVNQQGDKYSLDEIGVAYQSGGTAGEVALFSKNTSYSLDFILGLLDQEEIEFFLRKRGSPFRGGFFARGTDVITKVPVPKLDFSESDDKDFHDSVTSLVRKTRELTDELESLDHRRKASHMRIISANKSHINDLFRQWWSRVDDESLSSIEA